MPSTNTYVAWPAEDPANVTIYRQTARGSFDGYQASSRMKFGAGVPTTTLEAVVKKMQPGHDVAACIWDAGQYQPRIYQGDFQYAWDTPELTAAARVEFNQAQDQQDVLLQELKEICRVVAPDVTTDAAYGTRIRNLLIIACTEVEAQWRGVLTTNGCKQMGKHYCTMDYVKLAKPLRLEEYALGLSRYTDYPFIRPFKGWDAAKATDSLPWYAAYNATKHDRPSAFSRATLKHAIEAAAALDILMLAQYGTACITRGEGPAFFTLREFPSWHPTERSYAPPEGGKWVPVPHSF